MGKESVVYAHTKHYTLTYIHTHSHACTCLSVSPQAVGYGLVLLDGNLVNINKLKKLNLSRVDKLFRVSCMYYAIILSSVDNVSSTKLSGFVPLLYSYCISLTFLHLRVKNTFVACWHLLVNTLTPCTELHFNYLEVTLFMDVVVRVCLML